MYVNRSQIDCRDQLMCITVSFLLALNPDSCKYNKVIGMLELLILEYIGDILWIIL